MDAGQKPRGDKASDRHNDHCHRCCHEETVRPHKSTGETANPPFLTLTLAFLLVMQRLEQFKSAC